MIGLPGVCCGLLCPPAALAVGGGGSGWRAASAWGLWTTVSYCAPFNFELNVPIRLRCCPLAAASDQYHTLPSGYTHSCSSTRIGHCRSNLTWNTAPAGAL